MTQLTENVFAVEVPEGAAGFDLENPLDVGNLVFYLGFPSVFNFRKVSLPPGNWKILCTTREATEEQAVNIVQWSEWYFPVKHSRFIDYTKPYDTALKQKWGHGFGTAVESLNSLLTSKGLDVNKNYCLLKKEK